MAPPVPTPGPGVEGKPLNAAAISFSLFAIVLSWIVLFGLYPGYRADALRHRLTVLRDELFDLAAGGLVSFSHPSYLHLRAMLLAAIRSAEHLTFSRIVLMATACRLSPSRFSPFGGDSWEAVRAGAPPELVSIHERIELLIARHMASGSPLGWLWVVRGAAKSLGAGQRFRFWSDSRRLLPNFGLLALAIQTSAHCPATRAERSADGAGAAHLNSG